MKVKGNLVEDIDCEIWDYKLKKGKNFILTSGVYYTSKANAKRAAERLANKLNLEIEWKNG